MEERNRRKVLRGTVISDKMDKTIVVEIATTKSHPYMADVLSIPILSKLMMRTTKHVLVTL